MAIHEIHVEDAPKEVMEDLRLSFAHLESFAKRSSFPLQETASELVRAGLTSKHFTILPNSEVILNAKNLHKITLEETPEFVVCKSYCDAKELVMGPAVIIYKEKAFLHPDDPHDTSFFQMIPIGMGEGVESFFFLLCAAVVRDFWVLDDRTLTRKYEKRTSKVKTQVGSRKKGTLKYETKTVHIYLPRFRYTHKAVVSRSKRATHQARVSLSPHLVSGHLRRLVDGQMASEKAKAHASEFGITLVEGYTFVRPHQKGSSERLRTYRSKSALELIFNSSKEKPNDSQDSPS